MHRDRCTPARMITGTRSRTLTLTLTRTRTLPSLLPVRQVWVRSMRGRSIAKLVVGPKEKVLFLT